MPRGLKLEHSRILSALFRFFLPSAVRPSDLTFPPRNRRSRYRNDKAVGAGVLDQDPPYLNGLMHPPPTAFDQERHIFDLRTEGGVLPVRDSDTVRPDHHLHPPGSILYLSVSS